MTGSVKETLSGIKESYGLFINGQWSNTENTCDVLNKYTGEAISKVAVADEEDVKSAVTAGKSFLKNHSLTPYQRYELLMKVASSMKEKRDLFAYTLASEVGKTLKEAYGEVDRSIQTITLSAEEAKRIHGNGIPVEGAPGSENRMAFTIRVPVGVIAAITPFNVPLNLVCHKVGPAIAAGNAVVLKPATTTPVVSLLLCELFTEAGLPSGGLNVITGSGRDIGRWLVSNQDVNMFTFTGSPEVGEWIRQNAGVRKVALELGSNSATIVHKDADISRAAQSCAMSSFANAGQVCISVQRIFVHEEVYEAFLSSLKEKTEQLNVGDPFRESTHVGPMITEAEAVRVENWVMEACEHGADVITGGTREGALFYPTVLANVIGSMKVSCQEVFGPVVSVSSYREIDKAISLVNDSIYGLQAGIFTKDLELAMKAAREIEVGGVIINDTSAYRVDLMPYGGTKQSGTGKEGPAYAVEEMTDERLVVFNL